MPQLAVEDNQVRLYMDCGEAERTTFHRRPEKLTFSQNSGIFVANAGSTGLDKFEVSKTHYPYSWCVFLCFYISAEWLRKCFVFFLNKDIERVTVCVPMGLSLSCCRAETSSLSSGNVPAFGPINPSLFWL